MSLLVASLFVTAFLFSAYAIALTMGQYRSRIEEVLASRGKAAERVIRVGKVRYTGQRVRLVVVNPLETEAHQRSFAFQLPRVA
ncbi:MAG: hypothetical protein RSE16_09410 [Sphingobium sp.]|jgi:hypothetical protein|nr:MAG: hypothetical protein RSE16_09410 [Sphingobium sp.]